MIALPFTHHPSLITHHLILIPRTVLPVRPTSIDMCTH